jgi:phosphoglycerol geranylgeranyltransferase
MSSPGRVEALIKRKTSHGRTIVAALIDPEDFTTKQAADAARTAIKAGVSLILVGGSTIASQAKLDAVVRAVKRVTQRDKSPVVLFPGPGAPVSCFADAILFSSLLNSTNPYFIVGAQALGAMEVLKSGIESIPMGYLVFGNSSSASFIGQVNPLPLGKPSLAVIYGLAAQHLGKRVLYLEAGSGAAESIHPQTVKAVRKFFDGILMVGGGITSASKAGMIAAAGADIIVIGNLLQTPGYDEILREITKAIRKG